MKRRKQRWWRGCCSFRIVVLLLSLLVSSTRSERQGARPYRYGGPNIDAVEEQQASSAAAADDDDDDDCRRSSQQQRRRVREAQQQPPRPHDLGLLLKDGGSSTDSNSEEVSSNVIRLDDDGRRLVHLASINPMSRSTGEPLAHLVYRQVCAWLAWYHLERPELHILPGIRERFSTCDIDFSLDVLDTKLSQIHAARQLSQLMVGSSNSTTRRPVALIGSGSSAVSITLSTLASAYNLPQVSSMSTSSELDNPQAHPLFARTVPTNQGEALALIRYLQDLGVTEVAVLHVGDGYGTSFHAEILAAASSASNATAMNKSSSKTIQLRSFSFHPDDPGSLERALQQIKASGRRYVIAICNSSWKQAMTAAVQAGILGQPGYVWLFPELSSPTDPLFQVNRTTEAALALGLHGSGVLLIHPHAYPALDYALKEFYNSPELQEMFLGQIHGQPDDLDWIRDFEFPPPASRTSHYAYMTYDAVMTLAIAACEINSTGLFSGPELYQQMLKTEFHGASGFVSLDASTGTRRSRDLEYRIANFVINEKESTADAIRFTSDTSVLITNATTVQRLKAFFYSDNTTQQPPCIPPLLFAELNLVPPAIVAVGLVLGALVMLLSVIFLLLTFCWRETPVITASQPVFLIQLCLGTLLCGASIIPMSWQEPHSTELLDVSCMLAPWLLSIGFVLAVSALLAKTWRLNKLFQRKTLRRITVKARDVLLPLVLLMVSNVAILTAWTVVSPISWHRISMDNFDAFGQSRESYGICLIGDTGLWFGISLLVIDVSALVVANYQSYKARNISTRYSESRYMALSMFSLLQTVIISIPLLFLLRESPTSLFLVKSILVSISCLAVLIPIFVPKFVNACQERKQDLVASRNDASSSRTLQRVGQQRSTRSVLTTRGGRSTRSIQVTITGEDGRMKMANMMDDSSSLSGLFRRRRSSMLRQSLSRMIPGKTRIQRKAGYRTQRENDCFADAILYETGPAEGISHAIERVYHEAENMISSGDAFTKAVAAVPAAAGGVITDSILKWKESLVAGGALEPTESLVEEIQEEVDADDTEVEMVFSKYSQRIEAGRVHSPQQPAALAITSEPADLATKEPRTLATSELAAAAGRER